MGEDKVKERSFVQVILDREEEIKTAADGALKNLWTFNAKIFGETPADPSENEKDQEAKCFQNDMSKLQKQTISTLEQINNLITTLNEEFDN